MDAGQISSMHRISPVQVNAQLDPGLSRGLWLVKWLLAIPHYIVLFFLWIAVVVTTVVAFFAILFTGRYPRGLFDFAVGVLRWHWRVTYYATGVLGTDRYPPFSLTDVADYPARLEIAYPEQLSRGLVLVKWWLLVLPHYLLIAAATGSGMAAWSSHEEWRAQGPALLTLLAIIAGVTLLFTGCYPRSLFDLLVGLHRWGFRVVAYAALMTDVYPPFRLDQGGVEPSGPAGAETGPADAPASGAKPETGPAGAPASGA
jgi:hypothetical protein